MAAGTSKNDGNAISELRKRRERLDSLKARRPAVGTSDNTEVSSAIPAASAAGRRAARGAGPLAGMKGQKGARPQARQRQILIKVHKILTQTPEDDRGRVPDTPFTYTGVARLMDILRARAADESKPGAKAVGTILKFITAEDSEEQSAAGASIAKLQAMARRIDAFRKKAGGGGRRGAD